MRGQDSDIKPLVVELYNCGLFGAIEQATSFLILITINQLTL